MLIRDIAIDIKRFNHIVWIYLKWIGSYGCKTSTGHPKVLTVHQKIIIFQKLSSITTCTKLVVNTSFPGVKGTKYYVHHFVKTIFTVQSLKKEKLSNNCDNVH